MKEFFQHTVFFGVFISLFSYFYTSFKKNVGCTPAQFRKAYSSDQFTS